MRPPIEQERDLDVDLGIDPLRRKDNETQTAFDDGHDLMRSRQHFRVRTDYRFAASLAELPDPDIVIDTLGLVIIDSFERVVTT